jgi:hypothetical protein
LHDVHFARRSRGITETFAIFDRLTVNKDHHVSTQPVLIIDNIAAQLWVISKNGVEDISHRLSVYGQLMAFNVPL